MELASDINNGSVDALLIYGNGPSGATLNA
jgi:hypothetical protein